VSVSRRRTPTRYAGYASRQLYTIYPNFYTCIPLILQSSQRMILPRARKRSSAPLYEYCQLRRRAESAHLLTGMPAPLATARADFQRLPPGAR